ncbi:adhesion G-protein coupled receptor V1-like [Lineus longissimus]|uniref:adhesion G-protein coupled receptor V1-like n=1 Tax=Lineus longissimus TaxID=88925 RepID=UPI00315D2235
MLLNFSLQKIIIQLLSATNGGRISNKNKFTLTILANDNPHGTVEFSKNSFVVIENETDASQYVNLTRSGGTVGDLVITFTTLEIDIMTLVGETGKTPIDFFYLPYEKSVRGNGTKVTAATAELTFQKCSEACIVSRACEGFEIVVSTAACYWYTHLNLDAIPNGKGSKYYKKHASSGQLYLKQAQAGIDYGEVTGGEVIMADGNKTALLPITIKADTIPELDEKFKITLDKIKLKNASGNSKNIPYLGNLRTATVTIATNDDAHGSYRIYSNNPRASKEGSVLTVEERSKLAVEILVERQGGSLGDTSVTWSVNTSTSTAVDGQDFSASGATLNFKEGETRKSITIAILDDKLPENDETIILSLANPTGGATLSKQKTMYIIIMANDNVGGIVGFEKSSVLAKEGDSFSMAVKRTSPAIGNVTVEWAIQGVKENNPQKGFQQHEGTLSFPQSVTTQMVSLQVNKDTDPEVNEEYRIVLHNITTDGVSSTGAASLDPQSYAASITIEGSNDPHGIISFAASSLMMSAKEEAATINLVVNRKFGAIGNIRVTYDIMKGNISNLNKNIQLATPDVDFVGKSGSISLKNGVSSGSIPVSILDDATPEVDEVFIVKLTGTELLDSPSGFQPRLATTDIIAQVKIEANDGTMGVVHFSNDTAKMTVTEFTQNITLKVIRDQGAFGDVSVFFYTKDLGATPDKDYVVSDQDIKFADGERSKTIEIAIIDDSDPEPAEQFEVILASPKGGLELGQPIKAIITIRPSDDAGGHVRFESDAVVYLDEPSNYSTANSKAELQVVRGPGVFGLVNVPFTVTAANGIKNITDITPTQGFISIDNRQSRATLVVSAIMDVLSELDETFYFDLKAPTGGAILGNITRKTVIIKKNDSPFGLLQIYPAGTKLTSLNIEENVTQVEFDLVRTRGARDRVQVDLITEYSSPKGAIGTPGSNIVLSKYQTFPSKKAASWHTMNVSGVVYGVLLNGYMTGSLSSAVGSNGSVSTNGTSNNYTMIYRWQGVYMPVQTLETDGATSAVSFTRDNKSYLLIINEGSLGRYETNSRLYEIGKQGNATVLQDIPTKRGQKAVTFVQGSSLYAVVLNYQNNQGQTTVHSGRYVWEDTAKRFSSVPKDFIPTRGARDLTTFNIDGLQYLVVANEYDSSTKSYEIDSIVYRLEPNTDRFAIHQRINTKGAVGISHFIIGTEVYLVIANSRGNASAKLEKNIITYKWDRTTKSFTSHQEMTQLYANRINIFQFNGESECLCFLL